MLETVEAIEHEGETLDDLEQEWQQAQAEQEEEARRPDPEEQERAREFAKKINGGFLKAVKFFRCPHVDIDSLIDREKGDKAFIPLAEKYGGEMPPWMAALMKKYEAEFSAGAYMASTIYHAGKAEAEVVEYLRQQQQQEGAQHGETTEQ
ncbi:MAG: hypothetical protein R3303_11655 [Marinobacter sp.]|nr:hypothetical protein [Marinobacter sp.]